jgi:hypothetical protein
MISFAGPDAFSARIRAASRKVVLLLGAPLTAPEGPDQPGVPDVRGMLEMVRNRLSDHPRAVRDLQEMVARKPGDAYRKAFELVQQYGGQDEVNRLVRRAVLRAVSSPVPDSSTSEIRLSDDHWYLRPSLAALGVLLARDHSRFPIVLTTNFDPLIEVAIKRAGGRCYRSVIDGDGALGHASGEGTHVVYLHGYWTEGDTLHTSMQLGRERRRLKASLRKLLAGNTLVVCGYSGWSDVLMASLGELAIEEDVYPDIAWSFYDQDEGLIGREYNHVFETLSAVSERGRANYYKGVDVHQIWMSPTATSVSAPVRPVDSPQTTSNEVFQFWVRRIAALTRRSGGTRWALNDPGEREQVWSTLQSLVAIGSAARAGLDVSGFQLKAALAYVEAQRNQTPQHGGYGLWSGDINCFTEVCAWALIARCSILPLLSGKERERTVCSVHDDIAALLPRQNESGGWSPVLPATTKNARTYTSTMCTWALLELLSAKEVSSESLIDPLARSVEWLRSGYRAQIKGWVPTPARAVQKRAMALSAWVHFVLARAQKTPHCKFLEGDPKYALMREDFLNDSELVSRQDEDDDHLDSYDTILEGFSTVIEASRILWMPGVVLALQELMSVQHAQAAAVTETKLRLWMERLRKSEEPEQTYQLAERMIAASHGLVAISSRSIGPSRGATPP